MSWNSDPNDPRRYDDIIGLPHHVSETHPRMSRLDRAAQFAPFAALTGLDAAMGETARRTEARIELDENALEELDRRFRELGQRAEETAVAVTYFRPDGKKAGGAYLTAEGILRRIDTTARLLILADGTKIPLKDVAELEIVE